MSSSMHNSKKVITDPSSIISYNYNGFDIYKVKNHTGAWCVVATHLGIILGYKDPSHIMYGVNYKNNGRVKSSLVGRKSISLPLLNRRKAREAILRARKSGRIEMAQDLLKWMNENFWTDHPDKSVNNNGEFDLLAEDKTSCVGMSLDERVQHLETIIFSLEKALLSRGHGDTP